MVGMVVGITIILIVAAYARWQDLNRYSHGPLRPTPVIVEEETTLIEGKQLHKIAESLHGSRSDPDNNYSSIYDTRGNIILTINYRDDFFAEIAAVTVKNNSTSEIAIKQLHLSGYKPCYIVQDCQRQTLVTPIIFDVYKTDKPAIKQPKILQPGQSLTAYISGNLGQMGYAASICYQYDTNDPFSQYCASSHPIAWVRWY